MASPEWQELPNERPEDLATYYVVQYRWMTTPTEAEWKQDDWTWIPRATGIAVPWYVFPWFRAL